MANVARAIEQAASCRVNESLWWDSHESLFQLLDDFFSGSRKLPPNQVVESLQVNHSWLLDLLLRFKRPSAKSRSALDVAQVVIGDHKLDIKQDLKIVALDISKQLVLDEVQSYILVSRCFDDDEAACSTLQAFQKVTLKYFMERQCLLKCVRLLLLYQNAEPSVNTLSEAMEKEVNLLIKGGLEDKLLAVLEMLLTIEQPLDMDIVYINLWAEQVVMEEHLVLDVMFLVYFQRLCSCSFARWKELFAMFKQKVFVGGNVERLSLTAEAKILIEHVKHQCVLIMLQGFDLDKLLPMVHENVSFSQDRHPFAVSDLQQMDGILGELNALEVQEYAPLLLGWGIFGCLVSFLQVFDKKALDVNHTSHIHQAYEAGAFRYIQNMLSHKVMQETLIDGYKYVAKSIMSTFVAAYDIMIESDTAALDSVVEILNSIYSGQEMLCTEFWDRENILDGPLRNLLYSLRQLFPYRMKTLVQFLAGLAEGAWPAECVYEFLYKPSEITCVYHEPRDISESNQQITVTTAAPIPDVSGLFIPSGTVGQCLKVLDDQKSLVLWECKQSAIVVLLLRLVDLLATGDSLGEAHPIVNLLHRMLSGNKMLADVFLKLNRSEFCQNARSDGRMGSTVSIDYLTLMHSLLDKLLDVSDYNATAALCTNLFAIFAGCCPLQVMSELQKPSSAWIRNSLEDGLLTKLLHNICEDSERSMGRHALVISVLELSMPLVRKGQYSNGLCIMVMHMIGPLFLNHMTWKYKDKHERWKITTKIFELAFIALSNPHPNFSQMRSKVLDFIIADGAFHDVLSRVLSVSMTDIEALYVNRFVEPLEIEHFEAAVTQGFLLLHEALSIYYASFLTTDVSRGNTPLEHVLLHHAVGSLPFVGCVASLTGYFQNQAMQVASLKMLAMLCIVAGKALPHPLTISSYIQGFDQKQSLQTLMEKVLSKETAESNIELFGQCMELLTTATKYQPSLVAMLLIPMKGLDGLDGKTQSSLDSGVNMESGSAIEESILNILLPEHCFFESQPEALSRLLTFLRSLWEGGTELSEVLEVFRKRGGFWTALTSYISKSPSIFPGSEKLPTRCFQYRCQTSALQIMAWELFLAREQLIQPEDFGNVGLPDGKVLQGNSQENKTGVTAVLTQLLQASGPGNLLHSFAVSHYDKGVVIRANAEMRVLLVGLMLKMLMQDELGLSAALSEVLQESLNVVFCHPSFQKLLSTYLSQGYGHGRELYMLVISDLYFHLQGELEAGRNIPAGFFEDLVQCLDALDLTNIFRSQNQIPFQELPFKSSSIYDVELVNQHLGLEWWSETSSQFVQTARTTLKAMEQANMMCSLGGCQISAMEALTSIFSILVSDNRLVIQGLKYNAKDVYIMGVCDSIESTVELLGPEGDPTGFILRFILAELTLLLILLQWLLNSVRGDSSKAHVGRLCSKVVSTLAQVVKQVSGLGVYESIVGQLLRCLLGAYLVSLELLQTQSDTAAPQGTNIKLTTDLDSLSVSDVTTRSIELLPLVCSFVESRCHASLAISLICILIERFLPPQIWLPVFQLYSTVGYALSLLHVTEDTEGTFQVLNLLLSLSHIRSGVELLQSAGAFSHILMFTEKLKEELSDNEFHGPFFVWKGRTRRHELWGLSAAIIASFVQVLGESSREQAVDIAFAFLDSQKEQMLNALQSPGLSNTDCRKMRSGYCETTISALQETHQVLHVLVVLVRYEGQWSLVMKASEEVLRHRCIHLLAYIAREGLMRMTSTTMRSRFRCYPVTKEEIRLHRLPSLLCTTGGWFGLSAKGASATSRLSTFETNDPGSRNLLPKMSFTDLQIDGAVPTRYTDSVALYVYRISLLVLELLCRQAHNAAVRLNKGGSHNYSIFPEFPAPEILHGLQDQVMSIVIDICGRGATTMIDKEAQHACLLVFIILEKALFLEAFVSRVCGLGPLSVRSEDFLKEYKALLSVCEDHKFLDASVKALKLVAPLAYPSVS